MTRTTEEQSILDFIDKTEKAFALQDWWDSPERKDRARRSEVTALLGQIRLCPSGFTEGLVSVRRIVASLASPPESQKQVHGQSVGFKKRGEGPLRWIDVPNVIDPVAASRAANQSTAAKALRSDGYREYGISSMIRHVAPTQEQLQARKTPEHVDAVLQQLFSVFTVKRLDQAVRDLCEENLFGGHETAADEISLLEEATRSCRPNH